MTQSARKAMSDPIVISDVTCVYEHHPIFQRVSLMLSPGQFAGLVGPTGSGKTTLIKTVLGLVEPVEGHVTVFGRPVSGRTPERVGYVPQLEMVDWNFPVTVEQVVMMGRYGAMNFLPWPSRTDTLRVAALLERLYIADCAHRHIRDLSGGQQQRVFLARALIGDPQLLLLDEPTAGVDVKTQHDILHLLGELNGKGMTILLTTHDLNAVAAHLPWVICFQRGVIAQGDPTEIFTPEILRRTYNAEMVVVRHGEFMLMAHATPLHLKGEGRKP